MAWLLLRKEGGGKVLDVPGCVAVPEAEECEVASVEEGSRMAQAGGEVSGLEDRPCVAEAGVLRHHQDRHLPELEAAVCGSHGRPGAASGLVSSGKCCDETLLINVICGVVSGVISSAIANPTDVLKIRMQAQGSLFQGGMIGSFIDIYQQEGTRGLWRGVVPTAQRAAIVVGVELPVYDITKKHLILSGLMGDTIFAHFVSSFTCGLAGAIASNPVDVVRTRMMNQRAIVGSTELYKGTLDGLVKTWKSEGFFALYKGFWPNWLRLGPWNIIVSFRVLLGGRGYGQRGKTKL
ncbi:brain mitochondrial carrier protein 1 [Egretta garzetta]|uniref:brain mitochondrial carrier protein 1 n=1 Tax=Egretta garzetta TaxID=188379 RepID=UPI00163BD558|nr:brain mitochondrial carrier protein 1 [Egretta garzetta]